MTEDEIIWGQVVSETTNSAFSEVVLKGSDGFKYVVRIMRKDPNAMWVFEEGGPVLEEIEDESYYTEEGVRNRGFEFIADSEGFYVIKVTNPQKVNISMLRGMVDVDPEAVLTVAQEVA